MKRRHAHEISTIRETNNDQQRSTFKIIINMADDDDDVFMDHARLSREGQDGDDEAFHPIKVKPALKKVHPDHASLKSEKKGLKWDEKAIEEHDLLRGTRMKIDEPNTPYTHYDSGQESDDSRRPKSPVEPKNELSWDNLQNRLDTVAAVRAAYPSSPSSSYHSDEDERKKEMHQIEFKEHRKRHYNEMELVRKFRQEHPNGVVAAVVDDEEDNDDNFADDEGLDDR